MIQMKHAHQDQDETCVPELGLNMCMKGVQGVFPQQAVTSARVTAEHHDVDTGLKLVS